MAEAISFSPPGLPVGAKLVSQWARGDSGLAVRADRPAVPGGLLTVSEVASVLHVHVNPVRKWSDGGLLPASRLGQRGDRRFSREDVQDLLQERTNSGRKPRK